MTICADRLFYLLFSFVKHGLKPVARANSKSSRTDHLFMRFLFCPRTFTLKYYVNLYLMFLYPFVFRTPLPSASRTGSSGTHLQIDAPVLFFLKEFNFFSHRSVTESHTNRKFRLGRNHDVFWLYGDRISCLTDCLHASIHIIRLQCKMPDASLRQLSLGIGKDFHQACTRIKHKTFKFRFSPGTDHRHAQHSLIKFFSLFQSPIFPHRIHT